MDATNGQRRTYEAQPHRPLLLIRSQLNLRASTAARRDRRCLRCDEQTCTGSLPRLRRL